MARGAERRGLAVLRPIVRAIERIVAKTQEEAQPVPGEFVELCRVLQERGGGEVLEAVVFPVRPSDGKRP